MESSGPSGSFPDPWGFGVGTATFRCSGSRRTRLGPGTYSGSTSGVTTSRTDSTTLSFLSSTTCGGSSRRPSRPSRRSPSIALWSVDGPGGPRSSSSSTPGPFHPSGDKGVFSGGAEGSPFVSLCFVHHYSSSSFPSPENRGFPGSCSVFSSKSSPTPANFHL